METVEVRILNGFVKSLVTRSDQEDLFIVGAQSGG